ASALLFELLMDMAPEHRPYPRLCVQALPQAVGVLQPQGFHPGTADGYRMVVQTQQQMAFAGAVQRPIKLQQLRLLENAGDGSGHTHVDQDNAPVAHNHPVPVHPLRITDLRHQGRLNMVAGNPATGSGDAPDSPDETVIALGRGDLRDTASGQYKLDPG